MSKRRSKGFGGTRRRDDGGAAAGPNVEVRRSRAAHVRPSQQMRPERNVLDSPLNNIDVSTTHVLTLLNGCVQGSDSDQRIGRRINLESVQIDASVNPTAASLPTDWSVWIIHDKTPAGVAPTAAEILENSATYATSSPLNLANSRRFTVIRHFRGWIAGDSTGPTGHSISLIKDFVKLNITTAFNAGVAGTVGDIETGALYLMTAGNQTSGANSPQMRGYVRVRFNNGTSL